MNSEIAVSAVSAVSNQMLLSVFRLDSSLFQS